MGEAGRSAIPRPAPAARTASAPSPRHAAPSWRRPSKSTTATAVARFRPGARGGLERRDREGARSAWAARIRDGQSAALAAEHQDVVGMVAHRGVRARRACPRSRAKRPGGTSPPGTHPSSASGGDRRGASSRARRDADACRRSRSRGARRGWSGVAVATHRRADRNRCYGGISGATSTTCTTRSAGGGRRAATLAGPARTQHACAVRGRFSACRMRA